MKKKEIIDLLQNYEEDQEIDLYIKVYDLTGYYKVITTIEKIDSEGIHTSIVKSY